MAARPHFQKLVEKLRMQPPLPAAVVYPCDRESLQLATSGAFASYLAPTLVGPETRIRDLAAKNDIVQNTIQLAISLGIAAPNVALLAAMDGPAPAFPSTTDAVALKTMAAQGMFRGAIVDGPLTPDSALSGEAARINGVTSEVAGRVDVLIAPSMESALMVLRTLMAFNSGLAAGIVLGARVPIVI